MFCLLLTWLLSAFSLLLSSPLRTLLRKSLWSTRELLGHLVLMCSLPGGASPWLWQSSASSSERLWPRGPSPQHLFCASLKPIPHYLSHPQAAVPCGSPPWMSPRGGKVVPQGFVFALIHHLTLGSLFSTSALAPMAGNRSNGSFSRFLSNRSPGSSWAHRPASPLLVIKCSPRSSYPTRFGF